MANFNPRARDGRDTIPLPSLALRSDFNPRARDGRDDTEAVTRRMALISIHAPAMGATPRRCGQSSSAYISIHAPAMGATRGRLCSLPCLLFQSTRPRWARRRSACGSASGRDFNPRARDGRDKVQAIQEAIAATFQSTRPRWARRKNDGRTCRHGNFNPRAHDGRDFEYPFSSIFLICISIHAPAMGATTGTCK